MVKIIKKTAGASSDMFEQMIEAEADLNSIGFYCAPGSFAYTADQANIFQLDMNGDWVKIGG